MIIVQVRISVILLIIFILSLFLKIKTVLNLRKEFGLKYISLPPLIALLIKSVYIYFFF